jgi:hypothetical protein
MRVIKEKVRNRNSGNGNSWRNRLPIVKQITRKKNAEMIFDIFNSIFEIDIKLKNKEIFFNFYIFKIFSVT